MDSVSASVAARTKDLSRRQRQFVSQVSEIEKKIESSQLERSQISLNAKLLCQGRMISKTMFLGFAKNMPSFANLLLEYPEFNSGSPTWPVTHRMTQLEFSLKVTRGKLRKSQVARSCEILEEDEDAKDNTEQITNPGDDREFYPDIDLPRWWRFLLQHFQVARHNRGSFRESGSNCGFRYPNPELRKIYALMSLTGKLFYTILQRMLGFPSLTNARQYRRRPHDGNLCCSDPYACRAIPNKDLPCPRAT